jgi:antitoxin ParD1/3/4
METIMATLNVTIPDALKEFVDREVASGRFKDASAYVRLLIAEAMESRDIEFSDEEKERIDQMLLESLDSFERGEHAPVRPDEFEEVARRMVEQKKGKQAT